MTDHHGEAPHGRVLSFVLWVMTGMTVGAAAGLADGLLLTRVVTSITLPHALVLLTTVQCILLGGASGVLLGIVAIFLPPLLRGRPFSVMVPFALFLLLVPLGNRFFLPGEMDAPSLAFDAALLALAGLSVFLSARLSRRFPRRRGAAAVGSRAATVVLLLVVASLASRESAGGAADKVGGERRGPNLIILLIDTIRNDHVSWNGYERPTTPELDRITGEGAVFTDLVTQAPHTKAACASLLTSLYPASHTAVGNAGLPRSALTLAEVLSAAGYRTFAASANTFITPVFGFDQGFDRLVTLPVVISTKNEAGYILQRVRRRFGPFGPTDGLLQWLVDFEKRWFWSVSSDASELSAPQVIEPFFDWLGYADEREPFFAYLHFLEPHTLYAPPPPLDRRFAGDYSGPPVENHPTTADLFSPHTTAAPIPEAERRNMIARYDGEILYLDGELGRLVERLRETGVLARSLLVILGDHGETFYEHRMWGHGHSLYDEELRVPLAMIMRGEIEPGTKIDAVVRTVDVMPTCLDLLGVPAPPGLQGESLVPLLDARSGQDRAAYSEIEWSGWRYDCLREDGFKLIRGPGGPWLYDVGGDPREVENAAERLPERTASMLGDIAALRSKLEAARLDRSGDDTALDETTMDRLRALGYVQ